MGKTLDGADPLLARRLGLATVYQDDSLVRELTVAENLLLGVADGPATLGGKRDWAARLLAPYELDISPDAFVGQLNAVAAAVSRDRQGAGRQSAGSAARRADFEPRLFRRREAERASFGSIVAGGAAVVYVSHRLPEILALADRVTILRDGEGQGTYEVDGELSENDLIALMVGRPIEAEYPREIGRVASTRHRAFGEGLQRRALSRRRVRGPARRDSRIRRR